MGVGNIFSTGLFSLLVSMEYQSILKYSQHTCCPFISGVYKHVTSWLELISMTMWPCALYPQNHANLIGVSLIYEEKSHGMAVNKTINRNSTERERRLIKENFSAALRICTGPKKQQKNKTSKRKKTKNKAKNKMVWNRSMSCWWAKSGHGTDNETDTGVWRAV